MFINFVVKWLVNVICRITRILPPAAVSLHLYVSGEGGGGGGAPQYISGLVYMYHVYKRPLSPLSPDDALKHHFTSLKTDLIFLQQMALERKFPWNWFTKAWQFSLIFKPRQVIFIHWMKMTVVNSGLKGLTIQYVTALPGISDS